MTECQMILGDCLDVMKTMQDNSVDFVVTDPPYALSFMSKKWDSELPSIEIWKEALRICKPGAWLASFGGTRTHHRLTCNIEDAGWEIRDCVMWLYGSGFPKGKGCLKPAYEPIILARKKAPRPLLNIDGSRIEAGKDLKPIFSGSKGKKQKDYGNGTVYGNSEKYESFVSSKGRWPANLILDKSAAEMLDQQTGILKSGSGNRRPNGGGKMFNGFSEMKAEFPASSGGASRFFKVIKDEEKQEDLESTGKELDESIKDEASEKKNKKMRFFYCAKASSSERNIGLEGMPLKQTMGGGVLNNTDDDCGKYGSIKAKQQNGHPTVKPLSLMKYLIKLLAPPGDPLLLDPFAGSGSSLVAAKELGYRAIGIEKEEEYYEIAKKRVEYQDSQMRLKI